MCLHGSDRPLKCRPWIQDKSQKPGYELRNVIKFHEFPGAPPEVVPSPCLMSPLTFWDAFTGFRTNSGNDSALSMCMQVTRLHLIVLFPSIISNVQQDQVSHLVSKDPKNQQQLQVWRHVRGRNPSAAYEHDHVGVKCSATLLIKVQ